MRNEFILILLIPSIIFSMTYPNLQSNDLQTYWYTIGGSLILNLVCFIILFKKRRVIKRILLCFTICCVIYPYVVTYGIGLRIDNFVNKIIWDVVLGLVLLNNLIMYYIQMI